MTASQLRVSHEAISPSTRHATALMTGAGAIRRNQQKSLSLLQHARSWMLVLVTVVLALTASQARATSGPEFMTVAPLNFTTTFGQDNPLSQVFTVQSTGASFAFVAKASTNNGGNWLTINPSNYGCCGLATPYAITAIATPAVTLTAGTYTGQIELTASGVTPEVISVTLVVHATTDTYFDQVAGGLAFSMQTSSATPPPGQNLQVRNAGAGSLAWKASVSTADGGSWLSISSSSGTAPSNLSVSVNPANLPGTGQTAGTFIGQVTFTSTSDTVTVPITVNVGSNVMAQVNPLNFNKVFAGANPLSQTITVATTGTTFAIVATTQNSTGGDWLTITPNNYGCCGVDTPYNIQVGVNPAITLAAGTYMAEVIVSGSGGSQTLSIPVTLTVNPNTASFFDNVAGALNFSMATATTATSGEAPPAQNIQVRNAGAGNLDWTAQVTTADGGNWLSVSQATGAAPTDITVSVNPANLPGEGLTAGTFIGQVVLSSSGSRVTIPVSYYVNANVFRQVNPLSFTKVFGGANPLSQTITVASTGTNFAFVGSVVNGTGGSWLNITPSNYGCCGVSTPYTVTVSVSPAITLAAGTYSAEIYLAATLPNSQGEQALTIPVTLTVEPTTATFFDATPGQLSFYMMTGSTTPPPAQVLPIRNAGEGSLDWTATVSTSDGGNWLSISADSGSAPSEPQVSVNPANIPGAGQTAGTFTGQVLLEQNGQQISVPVSFTVGANVFYQSNPLSFTMAQGGANPLPQVITLASTGTTNFAFSATTANSTGGNWLTITPNNYGCCGVSTPYAITVGVNVPPTLAAGTYSAEVIVVGATVPGGGAQGITVPVTLTVQPPTATFFNSLPGQLSFSMMTPSGTPPSAPPSQPLQITNQGTGPLAWTATLSTADGGDWLSISAASGTAPSVPQVSVNPANLPGLGLVAGTFTGQVVLETPGDRVTIPVTFIVGASVFRQVNGLNFNKVFGGANPLPQLISFASTGTASVVFVGSVATSTGGNWLSITPSNFGCCGIATPQQMIVTVNPAVTLAAGIYTGEIILGANGGSTGMVVPVTLTVNAPNSTYFDDVQGGLTFSEVTQGATPPAQSVAIRNAGTGTLKWTATASTSDGADWLKLSAVSGTAPDTLTASINSTNLPSGGLLSGNFNGMIVLTAGNDIETIPVSVVVGANVFVPVSPIVFTKDFGGSNPGFKPLTLSSQGTNFNIVALGASAHGGNWLSISPNSFGCCGLALPTAINVSAAPVASLAPGTYTGEVIVTSTAGDQGMVEPVTLNVVSVPAATPVFALRSGTYVGTKTVAITDATPNHTIYYSLNGKTPTSASTRYTKPITVPVTEKVLAVAYAPGYLPSAVASASYTIQALAPKIVPDGGIFVSNSTPVTISDGTAGAEIFYTTNGSKPTKSSAHYTKAITVTADVTVTAVVFAPGVLESAATIAKFEVKAANPKFSENPGKYSKTISVAITDTTKNAVIYYTTNGSTPTYKSARYTKAIVISSGTETIKAFAIPPGGAPSATITGTYTITSTSKPAVAALHEPTASDEFHPDESPTAKESAEPAQDGQNID